VTYTTFGWLISCKPGPPARARLHGRRPCGIGDRCTQPKRLRLSATTCGSR